MFGEYLPFSEFPGDVAVEFTREAVRAHLSWKFPNNKCLSCEYGRLIRVSKVLFAPSTGSLRC